MNYLRPLEVIIYYIFTRTKKVFDRDGNGKISPEELKHVI
jgi:hypothetical protein